MASVPDSALYAFQDGVVATAEQLNQDIQVLQTAINDNYQRLINSFTVLNGDGSVNVKETLASVANQLNNVNLKQSSTISIAATNDNAGNITFQFSIPAGSLTASLLANGTITAAQLAANSVGTSQIAASAVTQAKLASNSVGTAQIQAGAVGTSQIANGAVTSTQIATGTLDGRYYTQTQLNNGQLDNRYYTQQQSAANLASALTAYYTSTQINAMLASIQAGISVQIGTAFPSSPVNGVLYYRSDLEILYLYVQAMTSWIAITEDTTLTTQAVRTLAPNLIASKYQSFTRSTPAGDPVTGQQVAPGVLRTMMGVHRIAPFIEEATDNIVKFSGFESVTEAVQVFADPLTAYTGSLSTIGNKMGPWTLLKGSFTFSASGATSTDDSMMTAGNPSWMPITGTDGSDLSLTVQATVTTPSTLVTSSTFLWNGGVALMQDGENWYQAFIGSDGLIIGQFEANEYTQLATDNFTVGTSTEYAITFDLSPAGVLTANAYEGATLVASASAPYGGTLPGPFIEGVGGASGVVCANTQADAPFPDGWTIGGEVRVAWAVETTNPLIGQYSVSGVGFTGVTNAYVDCRYISCSPSTPYTFSCYAKWTDLEDGSNAYVGVWQYDGTTLINNYGGTEISDELLSRSVYTLLTDSTATQIKVSVNLQGPGTVVFDGVQVEQKAYATSFIENTGASGSGVRDADVLIYDLPTPLTGRWAALFAYVPQQSDTAVSSVREIFAGYNSTGTEPRYSIAYNNEANEFNFSKTVDGSTWINVYSSAVSFNANDAVLIGVVDDPENNLMELAIRINDGNVQKFTTTDNTTISDASLFFVGSYGYSAAFANGTIEAIIHPLADGETITDDDVEALFNAVSWGQEDDRSNLPDKTTVGQNLALQSVDNDNATVNNNNGSLVLGSKEKTYITTNCYYDNDAWWRYDPTKPATIIYGENQGGSGNDQQLILAFAPAGANPITWSYYPMAQVQSGGYQIQNGFASVSGTSGTVTFPSEVGTINAIFLQANENVEVWTTSKSSSGFNWESSASISTGINWMVATS